MAQGKEIKNILIVDDDPVQTKLLERVLGEKGFRVTTATEAAVGLQAAMDDCPDLVILDVMMPVINGYNFCHILKSEEKQKNILIILITSRDKLEDVQIGMDMGADAYLTKPVDVQELLKTIKVVGSMANKN